MNRQLSISLFFASLILSLASSGNVYAATCTSAQDGYWDLATTWAAPCNVVGGPVAGDTVTIANGHDVTVRTTAAASSVTIPSGNSASSIIINTGIALSVSGPITITSNSNNITKQIAVGSGTLSAGSISINPGLSSSKISQVTLSSGTINVSGDISFSGTASLSKLVYTGTGSVNLTGNFGSGGTLTTVAGSVLNFNGSAAQTAASYTTYNVVKVNNAAGLTMTGTSTIATLTIGDVTANSDFNDGGFQVTSTGTLNLVSGTFTLGSATTATTLPAFATRNISTGTTVEYASGRAQNVAAVTYANLSITNNSTKTALGNFTVNGDLAINAGTFASGTWVQIVNGNVYNAGTHTASTGSITLSGGSSAHVLSGSGIYDNLVMSDAMGATLTGSPTVSDVLTLTSGDIITGTNTLYMSSSCSPLHIIGGSTSSYVSGNLRLNFPTGSNSCIFKIGDATAYAPVTVAMNSVTVSGTLNARTDTPDHADTTSGISGINGSKSVNRTWTLTPESSPTFSSYNPTFNFVAGDIDSGAATSSFVIGRKSGSWSFPALGAANPTSTAATGLTGFGEFAIGEQPPSISGTVFEDINYGGGVGRDMATSGGTAISGVRVELYNNTGAFQRFTTTNASGIYSFSGLANGNYTVRVSSTGIHSTRTGGAACTTCVPVQTYHTNATSGVAVAVTDHVGGETPTLQDAGDNSTSLASLSTGTTTAQSITTVTKGGATITGVDFGFNFDTIVSTRDDGQGSLRQFIINANALGGEGSLQQGLTAGQETSIFMIPNGQTNPGQNTGYTNQLATSGANAGAAVITLTTGVLPTISGANTSLDATTQTSNVGDTNSGTVGTGGTVGTMAQTLPRFNRPEVVIAAAATTQLIATGTTVIIKGLAVANGGISVAGNGSQVRDCLAGMNADGSVTTTYGATYGIIAGSGAGILISHNYVKVNNSSIRGDTPGANLVIEYNEVDSPLGTPGGGHTNTFDGILIVGSTTNVTVRYNLSQNQRGGGLEFGFVSPSVISGLALGNTIRNNGFTSTGTASAEPIGVAAYLLDAGSAVTVQQNVITGNSGPGLAVVSATGVKISQNSFFSNGTIGIDLNTVNIDPNTYTANGVTLNDLNDADTGPNGLLNYPVMESATISGGNLILKGWARPGSAIEFFIAAPDANGFGEGKTYLTTLTEGSGADTDATSSTYGPGAINGILQGTDNTNRFQFTIPIPGGLASGSVLTTTATVSANSSEFSGNVTVSAQPNLTVLKTAFGATSGASAKPGQDIPYQITVSNSGYGKAWEVIVTDAMSPYSAFKLNTLTFIDGSTSSGLSMGTVSYSYDNGTTWTATAPVDLGGGYNGTVTNWKIVFNPAVQMNANSTFTILYQSKVK